MAAPMRRESSRVSMMREAGRRHRHPQTEGVESIMTEVACVEGGASVGRVRELLVDHRHPCVPVVAADGRPIGVITQTDLLRHLGSGLRQYGEVVSDEKPAAPSSSLRASEREHTAGQIMTALVLALPVTASIEQAAALMAYESVEQIVVTSLTGQVVGVVRALDVARRCARSAGYLVDRQVDHEE